MNKATRKASLYYLGIGAGIIFSVAFVTSQIVMPIFFGREKSVEVPNLKDLSYAKASSILTDKQIHAVIRDSVWSDEIVSGNIVSQKPEKGEMLKPDGTVYLILSRGSKYVKVPYLIGLNVQAAWISLKNRNLNMAISDSVDSSIYPPNTVVETNPEAGERAERYSKVKIIISKTHSFVPPDTTNIIDDFEY